jgi:hypothetical protein
MSTRAGVELDAYHILDEQSTLYRLNAGDLAASNP